MRMNRMTGMAWAIAGWAIVMAMAAPTGAGAADRYWEWGWGSYGLGAGTVSTLDVARFDWTFIAFSNDPVRQTTVNRCNEILRLNPNHRFVIRVWPIHGLGDCPENGRRATFLHYLYAPGVKEELLAETRRQVNLILEGVSKPENVVGSFFLEELPGTFCPGVVSLLAGEDLPPWIVDRFQTDIEADLGAPLDWSNEAHRTWWGQKWVQVMDEIHATLKDATADRIVIYYQLTMVNTLDYYEALIEADPANAEIYPKSGFVPIHYADVVKPGLCDGIFGSPKSDWEMQTQAIVTNLNCLLFSQISLPPFMRSFTLEDTVNLARWENPGNLGSFLFYQLSEGPRANVWKDIPWQDDSYWTSSDHMRRFGWEYNIGMDVVATNLAPRVELDYSLKGLATGGMTHIQALIHNPRHPSWYGGQADLGLLENAGITLSVPDGFSIPLENNPGDTLDLGNIDADGYRVADWWVRLDKDDPSIPPSQTFRVVVTAESPVDEGIATGEAASSALDQAIPSFETHYAARSGDQWAEPALRTPHYSPVVELEALWADIDSPELVCDGDQRIVYQDILAPGTLLRLGPGPKAALFASTRPGEDDTGLDVSDRIEGTPADLIGPYTIWTYKDLSDPVPYVDRKIRIRFLEPEEVVDITIVNPSFEDTPTGTGWSLSGAGSSVEGFGPLGMPPGPDASAGGLFLQNGYPGVQWCRQDLTTAVEPDTTYRLTVDIGNWLGLGELPKFQLLNDDMTPLGGDATIGDGTPKAANLLPAADGWGTWIIDWTTGPDVGTHTLRLCILTTNEIPSGVFVDNLRLTKPAPPPPAVDIAIVNYSFEDTPLGTGWTLSGVGSSVEGFFPLGMPPGPDVSAHGLFLQNGYAGVQACRQDLTTAVEANTTYTLTVDIGNWFDLGQPPKFQLLNDDWTPLGGDTTGGDGTPMAANVLPVADGWGTWIIDWTTGASVGTKNLRIFILTTNEIPSGVFVDNLHLTKTVPPSGTELIVK